MSNWIDFDVDVLGNSPEEINRIAERLLWPSDELIRWVAERSDDTVENVQTRLPEVVAFKWVRNLCPADPRVNKARMFRNTFKSWSIGTVRSHLHEVSHEFPTAIFLLNYYDMQASYAGKEVMHAGVTVQSVHDGNQKAQAQDWMLPDIFAPFRAEYELELPFGSLWREWVCDLVAAAAELSADLPAESDGSEPT